MTVKFEGLTMNQLAERNAELVTKNEELQRKIEFALAAECVWETTMMQVCGEDGPASVAAEIKNLRSLRDTSLVTLSSENESLQRKIEVLAVENSIQDFIISAVKELMRESSGVAGWHLNGDIASWDEVLPEINHSEIPVTDAALAEIRAQGVDMFSDELGKAYQQLRKGSPQAKVLKSVVFRVVHFTQQLRKETANEQLRVREPALRC